MLSVKSFYKINRIEHLNTTCIFHIYKWNFFLCFVIIESRDFVVEILLLNIELTSNEIVKTYVYLLKSIIFFSCSENQIMFLWSLCVNYLLLELWHSLHTRSFLQVLTSCDLEQCFSKLFVVKNLCFFKLSLHDKSIYLQKCNKKWITRKI